jgi:CRISPR-associated protein Cas1
VASLLDGIGFDPYIGFFHQPDYGRPSLAADLLEEFRAPAIDRLTLRLINNRVFTPDDFYLHTTSGSTYLKRDSLRKYFTEYEQFLGEGVTGLETEIGTVTVRNVGEKVEGKGAKPEGTGGETEPRATNTSTTFREHFRRQAYRLERTLTAGVDYEPFLASWK